MDTIRSRILTHSARGDKRIETEIVSQVDQKKGIFKESIRNKVDMLQEEIRLGMLTPSLGATIHIEGDVGAINTGVVYGSIQGEITKTDDKRIAELFCQVADAINNAAISDAIKTEYMQNIELLVQQYNKPRQERNYGLISTSLSFLSAAANVTTIWAQYGQAIMDIFK